MSCPGTTESPARGGATNDRLPGSLYGRAQAPFYIRRDGNLIAFTITLAKPTPEEIKFFNDNFGTPTPARISVLSRGTRRRSSWTTA